MIMFLGRARSLAFLLLIGTSALADSQISSPTASPAPKNPAALKKLDAAIKAQLQNNFDEANQLYAEARALDPSIKGIDYQLAVAAYNQNNYAKAREFLAKSIANGEEAANCHIMLGILAGQEKKYPEAIVEFQKAAELNPADSQSYFNLSETYRSMNEPEKAIENLRAAIQRKPGEVLYAFKLRLAQIAAGQDNDFKEEVESQLQLQPPAGDWVMTAAALALQKKDYAQAAKYLYKAHDLMDPNIFFATLTDPLFKKSATEAEIAPFYNVQFRQARP